MQKIIGHDDMELAAAAIQSYEKLTGKQMEFFSDPKSQLCIMRQQSQLLPGLEQIQQTIINGILLLMLVIMNWQNN